MQYRDYYDKIIKKSSEVYSMKKVIIFILISILFVSFSYSRELVVEYPQSYTQQAYTVKEHYAPVTYNKLYVSQYDDVYSMKNGNKERVLYSGKPYEPVMYWSPGRKYKVYRKINPEVLYETKETVVSIPDDRYYTMTYSPSDPDKLYPVLARRVLIKNKWGQPIFLTGVDSDGRMWKENVDKSKRWYICDTCGRGYTSLNNVGHDLWLCDDCYIHKDYSGVSRDRWLSQYGLWNR